MLLRSKSKNNENDIKTGELTRKVEKQSRVIETYRKELEKLNEYRGKKDLFMSLARVLARCSDTDSLLEELNKLFSRFFHAVYSGFFYIKSEGNGFYLRSGLRYRPALMSAVPLVGSFMGESLYKKEIIFEKELKAKHDFVPLNQEPQEYNVICAPLNTSDGNDFGVIRIANIEKAYFERTLSLLSDLTSLISEYIEKIAEQEKNERTLHGLETAFTIARILEETLDEDEIIIRVCRKVKSLFTSAGCVFAMIDSGGGLSGVRSEPENLLLGGNPDSSEIYLKNLLTTYAGREALIKDIHSGDRRWSWDNRKVKSLCMCPVTVRDEVKGMLIVIGSAQEEFDSSHMTLLRLAAAQVSMTMERASYFRRQESFARLDGLTGLFNRRVFDGRIYEEVSRSFRYGRPLSLCIFDIDHFKKFNDIYGHQTGDEVLKSVAGTVKSMVRKSDIVYRYGGEEFAVLFPETTDENAFVIVDRLRRKVAENREVQGLSVTISLGVTSLKSSDKVQQFVHRADSALYEAKRNGRNRVVIV